MTLDERRRLRLQIAAQLLAGMASLQTIKDWYSARRWCLEQAEALIEENEERV